MWTVSETRTTMEIQVAYLVSCHVSVVFFPLSVRKEDVPILPTGFESYEDERGLFYFNPHVVAVSMLSKSLTELLGHVQTVEEAVSNNVPIVIQAILGEIVVQDSLVDSCDQDAVNMQEHVFRIRFPGCSIVRKLPEQVVWDRMKELRNGS